MSVQHKTHSAVRRWAVVASYFTDQNGTWLDDFISDPALQFEKIPAPSSQGNWHLDRIRVTGLKRWRGYLAQIRAAFARRPDGIITSFPQLAILAGLIKRLRGARCPIIAYNFNLGALPGGIRQHLARFAAARIDCFVVHSPTEIAPYAAYLGVPEARIVFVPLQRGDIDVPRAEDLDAPFIISMGSAHRDYPTLIAAAEALQIPTVIVTRPSDIDQLPHSDYVSFKSGLTQAECHQLLVQARLSVTPVSNLQTASGQITFIDSMRLGVPSIVTRCPGVEGYITHGETGILVNPFDVEDLKTQIAALWSDPEARAALSEAAMADARARFNDQVAADRLHQLIREVQSLD